MSNRQKKSLREKYQDQLSVFAERGNFNAQLLALVIDLASEAESRWDFPDIHYGTVMNKKEWQKFVSHPERKQYHSKAVGGKNFNQKFRFIAAFFKDAYSYYRTLKPSLFREKLRASLANLLDFSLNAEFNLLVMRAVDKHVGRSEKERDNGEVDPTSVSKTKLDYAVFEHCQFSKKDYHQFRKKIYQICNGRLSTLFDYYSNCQMEDNFRKDILGIFEILRRDQTIAFYQIKLGWEIWKLVREVGLDIDHYLALNGFPNFETVKSRLLAFQSNKDFVKEMLLHMKDELSDCYKLYRKQGFIENWQWVAEDARRKKFPKRLRTLKKVRKMVDDCQAVIYQYFPLAKKTSPRSLIFNPLHPEALTRAFQSSTKNVNGETISVIVTTPKSDLKHKYLPTLAHEVTHKVHHLVVDWGEKAGILAKDSTKRLPMGVLEEFSQLVEHLFYQSKGIPKKKFLGKEFPSFYSALVIRHQVPYALSQLSIRKEFDKWYDSGFREAPSDEMLWQLKFKLDPEVKKWHQAGVKVVDDGITAFGLFNAKNPDDGLVYMKRYLLKKLKVKSEKLKVENNGGLAEAFRKRFGRKWIENKDARMILLWLFLESGRNHKIEKYGGLVLEKDPKSCFDELRKIGVKEEDV